MAVPSHLRALASPVSAPALPERRMLGALLDPLQRAIRERSKVRVHYRDVQEQFSKRIIWPLGLYFWGHCWTLVGWCELRKAFRHFRVDRIVILQTLGDRYPHLPGHTLADYEAAMDARCTDPQSTVEEKTPS